MKAGCRLDLPTDPNHNAFIYAIDGELELEGQRALQANQLALYQRGESVIDLFSREGAEISCLAGNRSTSRSILTGLS